MNTTQRGGRTPASADPISTALAAALGPIVTEAVAAAVAELRSAKPPREILTRKAAAKLLGIDPSQLDRLAKAGKVQRHMLGESPRYLRSELIADLRDGKAGL